MDEKNEKRKKFVEPVLCDDDTAPHSYKEETRSQNNSLKGMEVGVQTSFIDSASNNISFLNPSQVVSSSLGVISNANLVQKNSEKTHSSLNSSYLSREKNATHSSPSISTSTNSSPGQISLKKAALMLSSTESPAKIYLVNPDGSLVIESKVSKDNIETLSARRTKFNRNTILANERSIDTSSHSLLQ